MSQEPSSQEALKSPDRHPEVPRDKFIGRATTALADLLAVDDGEIKLFEISASLTGPEDPFAEPDDPSDKIIEVIAYGGADADVWKKLEIEGAALKVPGYGMLSLDPLCLRESQDGQNDMPPMIAVPEDF